MKMALYGTGANAEKRSYHLVSFLYSYRTFTVGQQGVKPYVITVDQIFCQIDL